MHITTTRLFALITILVLFASCANKPKQNEGIKVSYNEVTQKTLMAYNKQMIAIQKAEIDSFISHSTDSFLTTPTGVSYTLPQKKEATKMVSGDKPLLVTFTIKLLNGKTCYKERQEVITLGSNTKIRGIGEALPYLAMNCKSQIVVPFHLAYGLRGNERIPAASPLLVEIYIEKANLKKDQ